MVSIGYTLLALACTACALSFSAPFWLLYPENVARSIVDRLGFSRRYTEGLLAWCDKSMKCTWVWDNDFSDERSLADWQKACQGLFAAGLLLLLIGWFIATFHVCCCHCCKESFSASSALGSLTLSGLVLVTASLTVYGAYTTKDWEAGFGEGNIHYHWAFFAGIVGAALALVACILFFCDGCRSRSHSGYHMTRIV